MPMKIEFKAEDSIIEEEESDIQYNFTAKGKDEILEILKCKNGRISVYF